MREITIISGKGGTGKTSITAAIATIAQNTVLCDNDVDAADLHLILKPEIKTKRVFPGAWTEKIDSEKCTQCGLCAESCRYNAISVDKNGMHHINEFKCEGCRLCERICPEKAIIPEQSLNNHWYVSDTRAGRMIHASMKPGEENSGKLVSHIRKEAREIANDLNADYLLNDGPPGIGCAAIASVAGTNLIVLVIEPSLSGRQYAMRLIELINSFRIPALAIINKSDMNLAIKEKLLKELKQREIRVIAEIPFDTVFVESMVHGQSITEYRPESEISKQIAEAWEQCKQFLS